MPGLVHVVDDDASFRTAIERRLKKAGYAVASYSSAQHLLDRLPTESEPGCILLDVRIPGLSGPELQSRLRELGSHVDAGTVRIPEQPRGGPMSWNDVATRILRVLHRAAREGRRVEEPLSVVAAGGAR